LKDSKSREILHEYESELAKAEEKCRDYEEILD